MIVDVKAASTAAASFFERSAFPAIFEIRFCLFVFFSPLRFFLSIA